MQALTSPPALVRHQTRSSSGPSRMGSTSPSASPTPTTATMSGSLSSTFKRCSTPVRPGAAPADLISHADLRLCSPPFAARTDDPLAIDDALYPLGGGSSSPIGPFGGDDSPVPTHRQHTRERGRPLLPGPRLGAMRDGLEAVRTYSRTVAGKERLVEAVIKEVTPTVLLFFRSQCSMLTRPC